MEPGSEYRKTEEACIKGRSPYVFVEVGGQWIRILGLILKYE